MPKKRLTKDEKFKRDLTYICDYFDWDITERSWFGELHWFFSLKSDLQYRQSCSLIVDKNTLHISYPRDLDTIGNVPIQVFSFTEFCKLWR